MNIYTYGGPDRYNAIESAIVGNNQLKVGTTYTFDAS